MVPCLIVGHKDVKHFKTLLESKNYLNKNYRITKVNDGVALPCLLDADNKEEMKQELIKVNYSYRVKNVNENELLTSKVVVPQKALKAYILKYLIDQGLSEDNVKTLLAEVPIKWDNHGDLIMFPDTAFLSDVWYTFSQDFWRGVASIMAVKRVAILSRINSDEFRTPQVKMILGSDSMVTHIDNGIHYVFDITKNMFCKGNISEKLRIAKFDCTNEIVLDMFAGIGYFTLPYLVKANAKHVTAIEWNPDAITVLKRNLKLNNVNDRCDIIFGDNREVSPSNFADRINLGLIPSSYMSWEAACKALKKNSGGWLHIHENIESRTEVEESTTSPNDCSIMVDQKIRNINNENTTRCSCISENECKIKHLYKKHLSKSKQTIFCNFICKTVKILHNYFLEIYRQEWAIHVDHIEHLKSYAPHIDNIVIDIQCRPVS